MRDGGALEALGRSVGKLAPAANLPSATALWAAAEVSPKNAWSLFNEAAAQLSWDPSFSRRLLRRYVDQRDVARAKQVLSPALAESPLDPFLCGVQGEILLHEGKLEGALGFLTKSCVSARARKEQEVLASTLSSLAIASARAKDPKLRALRDAAIRCAKGE
jgi:predicted Zn-dependent protease